MCPNGSVQVKTPLDQSFLQKWKLPLASDFLSQKPNVTEFEYTLRPIK
jgi:hypothetical protein